MARKDRRFTAEDVLRLYCKNLTVDQRRIVEAVGLYCGDDGVTDEDEMVAILLEILTSPPLSMVIARLPGGQYLEDVLTLVKMIVLGRVTVSDAEWKRINADVVETTRPTLPLLPGWLLPR